jgi:hypothetical protein
MTPKDAKGNIPAKLTTFEKKWLDYIRINCPDRKAAGKFAYGDYEKQVQMEMF